MRILFLSNFYPPASRGGYEEWCQEVLNGLRVKGHAVEVLTSNHGRANLPTPDPAWVHRSLHLEMELASFRNAIQFFSHRKKREQENLECVREVIGRFKPEAVLVWGMWNLQISIAALLEKEMTGRVVYYMGDYWPTLPNQFENYWNAAPRNLLTGVPKLMLKPIAQNILAREASPALEFEHMLFPTVFMQDEFKQKGILSPHTKIIYGAIDTAPYLNEYKKQNDEISLLYIGRLTHEKGVHTAIDAVSQLVREHNIKDLKLTIVGDGELDYETFLRQLVVKENLESFVAFQPAQPKEALPALYQHADIFLFTSIWPEPFGRVIVEAMASGVAVVGASIGGAVEIMEDGVNALLFAAGDSVNLTQQLIKLIKSPALRDRITKAGKQTAMTKFDIQRMTTEIEAYLQALSSK